MAAAKQTAPEPAAELAQRLSEALQRERIIPRFVDSYVVENGRHALQVHAALYRDLLALLQREALLAVSVCALRAINEGPPPVGKGKPHPLSRKDSAAMRRKFLEALTRQQKWTAGDALEFQSDLHLYEELLSRGRAAGRSSRSFAAANHPFVDRCAFLLDSSFLEKARMAASRTLSELEKLAEEIGKRKQSG